MKTEFITGDPEFIKYLESLVGVIVYGMMLTDLRSETRGPSSYRVSVQGRPVEQGRLNGKPLYPEVTKP